MENIEARAIKKFMEEHLWKSEELNDFLNKTNCYKVNKKGTYIIR